MKPYSRHQIEALLNKFMAGKTTIEEESLLSHYFSTAHDMPAEWEDYQALFGYIDRGLEGDLLPEKSSPSHRKWLWWIPAAAAAIVALVFGFKAFNKPETTQLVSPPMIAATAEKRTDRSDPEHEVNNISTDSNTATYHNVIAATDRQQPSKQKRPKTVTNHKAAAGLIALNEMPPQATERLQRELDELQRRAITIDMEAMGYQAVIDEDGSTIYVDMQQEINNQLNNQSTNIPGL